MKKKILRHVTFAVMLLIALGLGGCAQMLQQQLDAGQQTIAECRALAANPPEPSLTLKQYLDRMESRAWPRIPGCTAAAVQLDVLLSSGKASLLIDGIGPLFSSPQRTTTVTIDVTPGTPHGTATIASVPYAVLRYMAGTSSLASGTGTLVAARLTQFPMDDKDPDSRAIVLSCGLLQKIAPSGYRDVAEELQGIAAELQAFDEATRKASGSWKDVRAIASGIENTTRTTSLLPYAKLLNDPAVLKTWIAFESSLNDVMRAADKLELALNTKPLGPAWRGFKMDMLAFVANTRITLTKAKAAVSDEAQFVRDQSKGKITENFARWYLNMVDRSLVPLERGLDRFDDKAYGAGTIALTAFSSNIDDALAKSYKSMKTSLCGAGCDSTYTDLDVALGRASCSPPETTRAPTMMQFAYRQFTRNGAQALGKIQKGAPEPEIQMNAQRQQHALAEWSVREQLLAANIQEQLQKTQPLAGSATAPPLTIVAPRESVVEALASNQAAGQIVAAWPSSQGGMDTASFAASVRVGNNIATSEQVAVQTLNQQVVAREEPADGTAPARGKAFFTVQPGAIQLTVQTPAQPVAAAIPAKPGYCTGLDKTKCSELSTGFQWTVTGYGTQQIASPHGLPAQDVKALNATIDRVGSDYPDHLIRVEVHGFASNEPYVCHAMTRKARSAPTEIDVYAPNCEGNGNANPLLSFERAKLIRSELVAQLRGGDKLAFPAPFANGDLQKSSPRKVDIRVVAVPK